MPARPINHGTRAGYIQEWRRGMDPCDECREAHRAYVRHQKRSQYHADENYRRRMVEASRRNRREKTKRKRRGRIHDVIADHLEALTMQWGAGVPMAVVVHSILTRHPDMLETSVRRVFHRMIDDGRIVCVRRGDEARYRLNEAEAGG